MFPYQKVCLFIFDLLVDFSSISIFVTWCRAMARELWVFDAMPSPLLQVDGKTILGWPTCEEEPQAAILGGYGA